MRNRILVSLLTALLMPIGFWLGGFDFDVRGQRAVFCFMGSLLLFGAAWSYPGWYEK